MVSRAFVLAGRLRGGQPQLFTSERALLPSRSARSDIPVRKRLEKVPRGLAGYLILRRRMSVNTTHGALRVRVTRAARRARIQVAPMFSAQIGDVGAATRASMALNALAGFNRRTGRGRPRTHHPRDFGARATGQLRMSALAGVMPLASAGTE